MYPTILLILAGCILATGCAGHKAPPAKPLALPPATNPEQKTVRGILRHFPSDVKSVEAWLEHNFMVGDTPVMATDTVPEEALRKFIGSEVIVMGTWHAGEPWHPRENDENLQRPMFPEGEEVVRGAGLKLSSIRPAEKE